MRFRGTVLFSVIAVVLLVAAYLPMVNNAEKEAVLVRTLLRGLEYMHYDPQSINNNFSEKVYELYLNDIDGGKRFLTQEDVAKLEPYQDAIDEEVLSGEMPFFDQSIELLDAGLVKTQQYYREILAQPFDFSIEESVEIDGEKREFAKNDAELREYWRKYLKYEVLNRLTSELEDQKENGEEVEVKTQEELETEIRKDVLDMFDRFYDRMFKLKREDRLSVFLNSLTTIFDPHTNYFQPIDKENFNIRFSGRLEGIGARLMNDGDYTKVSEIVVGGPAWQGKELDENDIIMKVGQGKEEPVDIKGMVINDVVQLIRGDKGTEVKLTVKKVDGTVAVISIIRDIVILDESFAKSLILDGVNEGEKIGYLYLPSFYADFQNPDGRFCAPDVEAELEKLKAQNVDGIILDLRNNGGGSLRDVQKMTGFFIEKGPIVQVKSRDQNPEVLMDVDSRVQYAGPLIVMVNGFSASASEILAAALQDYGRAVIVGSNSTFGKGTVQRFVDLDRTVRGLEEFKPLGEVKLTTQKFYRINGGSTQLRGVTPDIILPDNFHYIKVGEKEEKYPMEWTEIPAVAYGQNVVKLNHLDKLRANSEQRVAQSPVFQKIDQNAMRLKTQRAFTQYPLSFDAFKDVEEKQKAEANKFRDMFEDVVNPGVVNLEVDLPSIHADESKDARNKDFVKSVSQDVYIHETLNIMHDLLKVQ